MSTYLKLDRTRYLVIAVIAAGALLALLLSFALVRNASAAPIFNLVQTIDLPAPIGQPFGAAGGVGVDGADNIYVAVQNCCVSGGSDLGLLQKYSPAGGLLTSFGSLDVAGDVDTPRGLALDASGNTVLIEDGGGFTIQTRDSTGAVIASFIDQSVNSVSVAVEQNGNYLLGQSAGGGFGKVQRRSPTGTIIQTVGTVTGPFAGGSVQGVAVDPLTGGFYANDSVGGADRVLRFSADGLTSSVFATGIGQPLGLATNGNGNVYVAQTSGGNQIHVFAPDGSLIETFGLGDLASPRGGIAIDSQVASSWAISTR